MKQFALKIYSMCQKVLPDVIMSKVVYLGRISYQRLRYTRCILNGRFIRLGDEKMKVKSWVFSDLADLDVTLARYRVTDAGAFPSSDVIASNVNIEESLRDELYQSSLSNCDEVTMYHFKAVIAATSDPFTYSKKEGVLAGVSYGIGRRMSEAKPYNHNFFESRVKSALKPLAGITLDMRSVSGDVFCHWLTEAMPRLYLLEKLTGLKLSEVNILASGADLAYKKEMLTMVGVSLSDITWLKSDEFVVCEELITFSPMETRMCSPLISEALERLFKTKEITASPSKWSGARVFVSRQEARFRKIENFSEVHPVLERHDFKVVQFEKMSVSEQLDCILHADVILGVHGSAHAFTHIVSEGHSVQVLEVFPPTYLNAMFCQWCHRKGIRYGAMTGEGAINPKVHDIGANVLLHSETLDRWLTMVLSN